MTAGLMKWFKVYQLIMFQIGRTVAETIPLGWGQMSPILRHAQPLATCWVHVSRASMATRSRERFMFGYDCFIMFYIVLVMASGFKASCESVLFHVVPML